MGRAIKPNVSVLVVDDDAAVRFGLSAALRRVGMDVTEAESCATAVSSFGRKRTDAVIADLRLPDGEALDLLQRLRMLVPTLPVFIMTGHGSIELAVRAVKEGAEDFLTKPVDVQALVTVIRRAVDRRHFHHSGTRSKADPGDVHAPLSAAMRRVEGELESLRNADCSVLILGETGTGKSVLARRIHDLGARADGPFIDVNCAGLTREFVESELFGHERGAFTGAHAVKPGLLDAADRGTLFLDEIGDIDLQVQPKILKVVEEKRFRRMGDIRERSVDVRLIAATHHDLLSAVEERVFRADLYYRLSTVSITMPSLRDRPEDLTMLAYRLLADLGAKDVELTAAAETALLGHNWPGNLRELKNVLERALLHRKSGLLQRDDLRFDSPSNPRMRVSGSFEIPTGSLAPSSGPLSGSMVGPLAQRTLSQVERAHIQQTLFEENGKVEAAAKRLGIPRSTLYQRMKEFGLQPASFRGSSKTGSGETS